ncbi:hypothetical protein KI387_017636, partial [Taxus chinensis]
MKLLGRLATGLEPDLEQTNSAKWKAGLRQGNWNSVLSELRSSSCVLLGAWQANSDKHEGHLLMRKEQKKTEHAEAVNNLFAQPRPGEDTGQGAMQVGGGSFLLSQDLHTRHLQLLKRWAVVYGMITQNVDRLHNRAGSSPIELHGTTHSVICLDCSSITCRHLFQDRVKSLNPEWALAIESVEKGALGLDSSFGMQQRPDGDVEIDERYWENNFHIPTCEQCGGVLKPNVVFFGDNVPKERASKAMATIKGGDALLVFGSSLMTMSAYRLVRAAYDVGSPIGLINIGPTRGDDLASLKIEAHCGEVLSRLLGMGSM